MSHFQIRLWAKSRYVLLIDKILGLSSSLKIGIKRHRIYIYIYYQGPSAHHYNISIFGVQSKISFCIQSQSYPIQYFNGKECETKISLIPCF